ncbi:NAD(P)H-dependent oxidoreductase subunit E [Sphingobium nicotianae]|uniref:NAD(P)H-dependent oxidoreductase subunit E n=1 Tax=Sphingobium nicotianae TaxID=2782607 RepID=A0A9X1DBK4_9SPHN|nr:NAD(P)H-dependent oxidoreductase subunit E [Sphingobium nicotianae]MBT2187052.1 NAD(P)H-dependent oxidoreductase subunit E [Sphingobium nicotianae]
MADDKAARLDEIIASHGDREGPLLPILHDIQEEFGCIEEEAKRQIAAALNLSRAEVHGVVSFYHDFKAQKADKPVLKLCRAESCKSRGVEALVAHAQATAGDRVEIETVYCLGLCSVGPNAMVGKKLYAYLDDAKLASIIKEMV